MRLQVDKHLGDAQQVAVRETSRRFLVLRVEFRGNVQVVGREGVEPAVDEKVGLVGIFSNASDYRQINDDPLKDAKEQVIKAIWDAIKEYTEAGEIYYDTSARSTEYFFFHTKQ